MRDQSGQNGAMHRTEASDFLGVTKSMCNPTPCAAAVRLIPELTYRCGPPESLGGRHRKVRQRSVSPAISEVV